MEVIIIIVIVTMMVITVRTIIVLVLKEGGQRLPLTPRKCCKVAAGKKALDFPPTRRRCSLRMGEVVFHWSSMIVVIVVVAQKEVKGHGAPMETTETLTG